MSSGPARFREQGGPSPDVSRDAGRERGQEVFDAESRRDRLQPYLIDRLTDDAPGEEKEGRERRTTTVVELRRRVLRDLQWLLNTRLREEELTAFTGRELASQSVLRYGIPDLSGRSATRLKQSPAAARKLEKLVREAIRRFEPRIVGSTLRVRVVAAGVPGASEGDKSAGRDDGVRAGEGEVILEIHGEMFCQPANQPLLVQTAVDLNLGTCEVHEV